MKCYLVWYRLKNSSADVIRGVARNYERAERMAESLELLLSAQGLEVEATGVKSGIHGQLYDDDDLHMRWSVVPPEPEEIEMKEYLVTGGLGFIGSHVVEALLREENTRVWVIDNGSNVAWNPAKGRLDYEEQAREILVQLMGGYEVADDPRTPRLVCIHGDFAHPNILDRIATSRFTGVFHLAGRCSVVESFEDPENFLEENTMKTLRLAKACAEGNTRLIFSSSAAVYGNVGGQKPIEEVSAMSPMNPYGATKMTVENWLKVYEHTYGLQYLSLRYFNVYGPRQQGGTKTSGAIANFIHNTWMEKPITIYGDGNQTRDWVYVTDVARANVLAMTNTRKSGLPINICTKECTSLNDILSLIKGNIQNEEALDVSTEMARFEVYDSIGDNLWAYLILEWVPTVTLQEGIRSTLDWRGIECKTVSKAVQ